MAKVDVRLILIVFFSFQRSILTHQQQNVDPKSEDTIDVDLWNRFNHEDMEKMPIVDDFSNEIMAMKWLRWYSRISERYYQVSQQIVEFYLFEFLLYSLDQCSSRMGI